MVEVIKAMVPEIRTSQRDLIDSTIAMESFVDTRLKFRGKLFQSNSFRNLVVFEEKKIDYMKLIDATYQGHVFRRFVKIILSVPNIIIEESLPEEVGKQLRSHPLKCFSQRTIDHVQPKQEPPLGQPTNRNALNLNDSAVSK